MDEVAIVNYSDGITTSVRTYGRGPFSRATQQKRRIVMKVPHAYGAAKGGPIEQVKPFGSGTQRIFNLFVE
ncbi:unnamed protein product [Angiostrongylus costaricensis]|uniref:MSP domain-containing protein n=1 Tax=Angiostrongylus costaricensis TaxID=334426 RepID=A0A0R3PNX3_ANGCS|nr:unnamed protein product [Angiostrongylus costaricensis]